MSPTATATRARAGVPAHTRAAPRRAPTPRRPHLRIVEEPGRRSRRRRRTVTFIASVTGLALLTVVAFYAMLAQSQVAIDRLERQTAVAQRRYAQARFEHAQRSAPQRIIGRAEALGLVAPVGPPTAIPVQGEPPVAADATSPTLQGATEVKASLGTAP